MFVFKSGTGREKIKRVRSFKLLISATVAYQLWTFAYEIVGYIVQRLGKGVG